MTVIGSLWIIPPNKLNCNHCYWIKGLTQRPKGCRFYSQTPRPPTFWRIALDKILMPMCSCSPSYINWYLPSVYIAHWGEILCALMPQSHSGEHLMAKGYMQSWNMFKKNCFKFILREHSFFLNIYDVQAMFLFVPCWINSTISIF